MRTGRALGVLCALFAGCASLRPAGSEAPYDWVITGGRIVDGTGNPWFYGDLAIRGDRIARIAPPGMLDQAPARRRLAVPGLVVAPGFIDIQSHSREAFLRGDGRVLSKVTQGVTTEILGEGWTDAPVNEQILRTADPADRPLLERFQGPRGFRAWLEYLQARGLSVNVGSFLGASTVRQYVKGLSMGPATPEELDSMRALVRRAMQDGAFGLASALIYPPGSFASTEELIALCREIAPFGGIYITHLRSEADRLLEALDEALRIGREAGVPVEIYHLKAAGVRNWHKAALAVAHIDSARRAGLDVAANVYPYTAGGTGLSACLPPWAAAEGRLFDNLRDPEMRRRIRAEIERPSSTWENLCELATPEGVLLLGLRRSEHQRFIGRRLSEVASELGKDWIEVVMDLLLAEGQPIASVYFLMSEENLKLALGQPWIKIGTDAGGFDPATARGPVHPRAYGTYPRILGRYVRQEGLLSLEEAIRKMTSAVANRLQIRDRGLLREGLYADIVIFDPVRIRDRATFEDPHQLSDGVLYVFVNGEPVLWQGRHTGARPGRIVWGPGRQERP
ncbi:MAG: D-aminoacylase [Bacteroidetes bacterium]|nr:D-aminoacylase [Rhodothermia bacterium]MCS7154800.1 D-aminoacylase [Bacteroidota bacterium]MCX7907043.1 D-aminoacylase [Bacteroidota bacterium]MDW8137593.1 D-aminoacylase [Bacteroidota bacterium]MDW8285453.1 D-aminoacylase [Bacteroidota bacterium]